MVYRWQGDGMADSEKITINMNVVDLGQVDLLVEQGFYSNRTDFIRTAIRNLLNSHSDAIKETVTRKTFVVGVLSYSRNELEKLRASGRMLEIKVVGLAIIGNDVSPELAASTIQSLEVHGVLRAPDAVKAALSDRMLA